MYSSTESNRRGLCSAAPPDPRWPSGSDRTPRTCRLQAGGRRPVRRSEDQLLQEQEFSPHALCVVLQRRTTRSLRRAWGFCRAAAERWVRCPPCCQRRRRRRRGFYIKLYDQLSWKEVRRIRWSFTSVSVEIIKVLHPKVLSLKLIYSAK